MKATRSGDDLECLRAASLDIARDRSRPDQERHEHAARADRGENVGHVRGLAAIAHIGLADTELAKFDICELHGWALLLGVNRLHRSILGRDRKSTRLKSSP